jgi:hypothetical protein
LETVHPTPIGQPEGLPVTQHGTVEDLQDIIPMETDENPPNPNIQSILGIEEFVRPLIKRRVQTMPAQSTPLNSSNPFLRRILTSIDPQQRQAQVTSGNSASMLEIPQSAVENSMSQSQLNQLQIAPPQTIVQSMQQGSVQNQIEPPPGEVEPNQEISHYVMIPRGLHGRKRSVRLMTSLNGWIEVPLKTFQVRSFNLFWESEVRVLIFVQFFIACQLKIIIFFSLYFSSRDTII